MRRRLGIWGASEESLRLLRLLSGNPDVEVLRIFDDSVASALERARGIGTALAHQVAPLLLDDEAAFFAETEFDAIIDARGDFASHVPAGPRSAIQAVTPLTARLLWGYGVAPRDRKAELLQALHEVVESVDMTVAADELFERMLEIAVGVTGAEGGSLMLLDPRANVLRIRVAQGVEPELWPKIRVELGQGISGRVAAEGRPIHLRGRADGANYDLLRERVDVESALCVPMIHHGKVLGVINVHHSQRADVFSDDDLAFMEQLASLDAQIIARAQEHESLRSQAARYDAIREVQRILSGAASLTDRLEEFCRFVAERAGQGIAQLYLRETDGELRMVATSLEGSGFGGEYRLPPDAGVDGDAVRHQRPALLRYEDGRIGYAALPLVAGKQLVGLLSLQAGATSEQNRGTLESWQEIAAAAADTIARRNKEARMATQAERVNVINEPAYGDQLQDFAIQGIDPEGDMKIAYTEQPVELADGTVVNLRKPAYSVANLKYGPMHPDVMISPRVAPQMIGLGLLEMVPAEDILAHADPDDRDGDGISGRANRVWDKKSGAVTLGRFGWKAGNPSVHQQSGEAFAGDIGISNPVAGQAWGDCTEKQTACREAPDGASAQYDNLEAPQDVLELVTHYSRNLAVPARRDVEKAEVLRGKKIFYESGCVSCHVPKFITLTDETRPEHSRQLIWPYTDMLLHDMGEGLADNRPEGVADGTEWRTPPLWGIGLTKTVSGHTYFLHDGRARNLLEAILWHGGEAEAAKDAVTRLNKEDRDALIEFLESL